MCSQSLCDGIAAAGAGVSPDHRTSAEHFDGVRKQQHAPLIEQRKEELEHVPRLPRCRYSCSDYPRCHVVRCMPRAALCAQQTMWHVLTFSPCLGLAAEGSAAGAGDPPSAQSDSDRVQRPSAQWPRFALAMCCNMLYEVACLI